jgi:hypothetical protein
MPVDCFKFLLLLRRKGSKMDRNWRVFCEKHWQSSIKLKGSLLFSYNISFFYNYDVPRTRVVIFIFKDNLGELNFLRLYRCR